jgi:aspartokinase/homoserine dehydrogenase 1
MKINCCSFWLVTDLLQLASQKQAAGDENFKVILTDLEKAFRRIKRSYPISEQSSLLSHVKE